MQANSLSFLSDIIAEYITVSRHIISKHGIPYVSTENIGVEITESIEYAEMILSTQSIEIVNKFSSVLSRIEELFDKRIDILVRTGSSVPTGLWELNEIVTNTLSEINKYGLTNGVFFEKHIRQFQECLIKLGYKTFADGVMGPSTQRAILNYKSDRNLPQTTDLDGELLDRLQKEAEEITSKEQPQTKGSPQPETQYWIIKLNPDNWPASDMEIGGAAWYNLVSENLELLNKVNEGDKILGYKWEPFNKIVCVFNVTKAAYVDGKFGHVILMQISKICDPPISIADFSENITFAKQLLENSIRVISISGQDYNTILNAKSKVPPPTTTIKSYYAPLTTEGNHAETEDKLQFENDITSLATVISLKDVKPPLAIGLFGNWGSGKSFFMEKLISTIDEFTTGENEGMVKNVVQVKFNSWHYSDANLWASLITEIFDSLHDYSTRNDKEEDLQKLSQTLHITGLQKEEAEKKKQELEDRIHHLEEKQEKKRQRLEDVSGIGLLKLVLSDKLIQKDLHELNNDNIESLVANRDKIDNYIAQAQGWGNRLQYIGRSFANMQGGRWIFVVAIFVAAILIPYALKWSEVAVFWNDITLGTAALMSAIVTGLAQLLKTIKPALTVIDTTVERLQHLRKTINARELQTNAVLNSSEQELKELTESLQHIEEKIKETRKEISDIKSGKRLLEFIQNRSKDESYAQQLGLISWIRKDFKRLDDLLRKQHKLNAEEKSKLNPTDVQLQIDRIVLYIDDLDRCKEDVVVKVLEAVHLLLAFPLFVVVVGVDPRWLNNALAKQYEAMFKANGVQDGKANGTILHKEVATTYDYLEKIFQVPFALKPINKDGQGGLIEYLLRNEMEKVEPPDPRPNPHPAPAPSPVPTPNPIDTDEPQPAAVPELEPIPQPAPVPKPPPKKVVIPEPLTFTAGELSCMKRLSSIFGHTPRGINRYVNIYRIIKSHNGLKIHGAYDEDEYIPILFTLAIVVGYSAAAKYFIDAMAAAEDEMLLSEIIADAGFEKELNDIIHQCLTTEELNMHAEPFKRNLELIARFSFRTIMC